MNLKKTNAARLLDELHLPYTLHGDPLPENAPESELSGVAMARRLNADPLQVFKTLVARGDKSGVLLLSLPAPEELDLKKAAQASGNKSVTLVALKEVLPLTGYMRGGCSPLGTKKQYPWLLDESALLWEAIYVSAGLRGVQLLLSPEHLLQATAGSLADLCRTAPA